MIAKKLLFGAIGAGGAVKTYATWNPSDAEDVGMTSNGDLTFQDSGAGGSFNQIRSTIAMTTGKWYWEIKADIPADVTAGQQTMTGLMPADIALSGSTVAGDTAGSVGIEIANDILSSGWYGSGSAIKINNVWNYTIPTPAGDLVNGSVVSFAFDADTRKIWIGQKGVWMTGDPATNTSPIGTLNLIAGGYKVATCSVNAIPKFTANFGATPFLYAVPAGFNEGVYST